MRSDLPERTTPPAMISPPPFKTSEEVAPKDRIPLPVLVRPVKPVPAVEVSVPLNVVVTAGLAKLIVRAKAPRSMLPARFSSAVEVRPPMVKSPLTVTALWRVRTLLVLSARSVVPPAMVRVPVPSGPRVTTAASELAAIIRPPSSREKPVVKTLSAEPMARVPAPFLTIGPVMARFCVMPATRRMPTGERPALTVMVGLTAENSRRVRPASFP